ncbi:MAG: hypothetical protein Q4G60_13065, partial [bacterium]|nr:hypothetical protein [bacterium]
LTEYNEKKHMKMIRRDARAEGRAEGRTEGENRKLIEMICKKIAKNKSLHQIAAELEEEEATILPLYEASLSCAPDYDIDQIYEKVSLNNR